MINRVGSLVLVFSIVCLCTCARKTAQNQETNIVQLTSPVLDSIPDSANKVVVKTCVNWKGEVVSTTYQKDQSIVTDTAYITKAIQIARGYKFNVVQGSPIKCTDITIKFKQKKQ